MPFPRQPRAERPAPRTSVERRGFTAWVAKTIGEAPGALPLTAPQPSARDSRAPLRAWLTRVHGVPSATVQHHEAAPPFNLPSGTGMLVHLWRHRADAHRYVATFGTNDSLIDLHATPDTLSEPAPMPHQPSFNDTRAARIFDADPIQPMLEAPQTQPVPPVLRAMLAPAAQPTPSPDTAAALAALLATLTPAQASAVDEVARDVANRAAGDAHQAIARANASCDVAAEAHNAAVQAQKHASDAAARAEEIASRGARPLAVYLPHAPMRRMDAAPRHPMFPVALAIATSSARTGRALLLVGPAGSGKTTGAQQMAEALGLTFYVQGACTGAHDLLGFVDGHGRYQTTPFRKAFEDGGYILLDEMDASDAAALLVINSAVANGSMGFPDRAEPVKRHASFVLVASANTYGAGADRVYVGRAQLDGATLDRFNSLAWNYDEALENTLTALPEASALVQAARAAIPPGAPIIISPRASVALSDLTLTAAHTLDTDTALAVAVWGGIAKQHLANIKSNCAVIAATRAYASAHAKHATRLRAEATKAESAPSLDDIAA